jgi:Phospholipid methyltransferase
MGRLETIRASASHKDIFKGQLLHIGLIILMVLGASSLLMPSSSDRVFLGWNTQDWAICSITLAVVHQVIVAIVFRFELYKGLMTRVFQHRAMKVWALVFLPFLVARPITIIIVGWLDTNPITAFQGIERLVGILLILLAVVTMHSVIKYFTIRRALGADHFDNDIIAIPLVAEGMFKYTSNGMYGIVFLGFWGIALAFGSWNALVVAFFQHTYIWVHMYLTEQPDMDQIYGDQ